MSGGGIRIALQAEILKRIWPRLLPDLIIGTSAGGLNALCLSIGMKPADVADVAAEDGAGMFSRAWWRLGLTTAKYDNRGRLAMCNKIFGDLSMAAANYRTMITSYDIVARKPHMWKSWGDDATAEKMLDAAMATSAAPTFFGAWKGYIDGGVFANNPAVCGLAEAKRLWPGEVIGVVSVGTGYSKGANHAWNEGISGYAVNIASIILDADASAVDYVAQNLCCDSPDQYISINPDLGLVSPRMDLTADDHIEDLREIGRTCLLPKGLDASIAR